MVSFSLRTRHMEKKIKEYGLKQLSKEEHIKKQVPSIISLPLVPKKEISNFMEQTIDVFSNIDSKFNRLTDYVLNTYVEDAQFTSNIWNRFDLISERSCTNNHPEAWHRQLNEHVRAHHRSLDIA